MVCPTYPCAQSYSHAQRRGQLRGDRRRASIRPPATTRPQRSSMNDSYASGLVPLAYSRRAGCCASSRQTPEGQADKAESTLFPPEQTEMIRDSWQLLMRWSKNRDQDRRRRDRTLLKADKVRLRRLPVCSSGCGY
jgi:hypothetical protein